MSFPERLKQIVELDFDSQNDLAHSLGISKVSISTYVNGKQKPKFDILKKFFYLGYNINWLVSGKGDYKRDKAMLDTNYTIVFEDGTIVLSDQKNFDDALLLAQADQLRAGLTREVAQVMKLTNGIVTSIETYGAIK